MSKLAAGCLSFGMGIFLTVYFFDETWLLSVAGALCAAGIVLLFIRHKKLAFVRIMCFCIAVGLLWSFGYDILYHRPAEELDGIESVITAKITDYPLAWQYGYKVESDIIVNDRNISSLVYCHGDTNELIPGDIITCLADISLTDNFDGEESFTVISKGQMLYAYTDDIRVIDHDNSIIYTPKIAAKAVRDKIEEIFPDDVSAFLQAMLIGDRTDFSEELTVTNAFSDAGVYHIIAVSGLHVSFFAGMIYMLLGRRKWTAAVIVPLILFFMAMTGFTPSVTRAGIMQIFVVMAPVFNRENDSITSLSVALTVILLVNPYAIAHAGLQMSFLATLGMMLMSSRMQSKLLKAAKVTKRKDRTFKRRIRDKILLFLISGLSSTAGALVLTMPLTALYFGNISLAAPIANMLILWIASFVFSMGLIVCAVGFIWMPLASVLAYPVILAVRYILWITVAIGNSGFAAVYTSNKYIIFWFVYVYLIGTIFVIMKAKLRQVIIPICLSVILLCTVLLVTAWDNDSKDMSFTALDVGQGQSIVMTADEFTAAIDCGGSYFDVGNILADYVLSMGRSKLDVLVLTHFDSDHCNGFEELAARIDISVLIVPDPEICDSDMAEEIIDLAESSDIEIVYAYNDLNVELGDSELRVYAPLKAGDENEMSLVSLFSCNDFDVLVTGDIGTSTERILVREKSLPDVEVLVAGHHGSKRSTGEVLLEAVQPETVVISVGDNSYGHPADEVLDRAYAAGAEVFRTDEMGNITITYEE